MSLNQLQSINTIQNSHGATLDVILCDQRLLTANKDSYINVQKTMGIVTLDKYHPPLTFELPLKSSKLTTKNTIFTYNFKKTNLDALRNDYQNYDLSHFHYIKNVDQAFEYFYKILYYLLNKHVPKFKNRSKKHPLWWSKKDSSTI